MGANKAKAGMLDDVLYPPLSPFRTARLRVSDTHELHVEESGNPEGRPVLLIHGGPGVGIDARARRFFNPAQHRIIAFDQRGCGQSTPHGSLADNTTWHVVGDIEALRITLGIDNWLVFGGSWGATLALAYAQKHPERVRGLILRGIFLHRRSEIAWFYQDPLGAASVFPDAWADYISIIPVEERDDIVAAYYRLLTCGDAPTVLDAAKHWSRWEAVASYLVTPTDHLASFQEDLRATSIARIESHYFVHRGFFHADDQLLRDIDRIRHIPGIIVQGRYDMVCPMRTAWDLHLAWPEAELQIVADAGHSAFEPGIAQALVTAAARIAL